jgi:hypothetical protein
VAARAGTRGLRQGGSGSPEKGVLRNLVCTPRAVWQRAQAPRSRTIDPRAQAGATTGSITLNDGRVEWARTSSVRRRRPHASQHEKAW